MVSKRHLKKGLFYLLVLFTLLSLYVMSWPRDVTTLPTVTVPYGNLIITFPVTDPTPIPVSNTVEQKPPLPIIKESSSFIPGDELVEPEDDSKGHGKAVKYATLPSQGQGLVTPVNTPVTLPLPTPSSPMEERLLASEEAEALRQESEKVGTVPDDDNDDVDSYEEEVEIYEPQFLVRSNENMIFNDVLSEDVLPDYTAADTVEQYEEYLQETQINMEERLAKIRDHCKVKAQYLKTPHHNLYYFPEHNMTWCPVFKAASTNWKMFFCRQYLPGIYQLHINNPDIKNLYCELNYFGAYQQKNWATGAKDWAERAGEGVRFLTARHPYERLVSAYRNKFEDCRNQRFNNGHTLNILSKYRKVDPSTSAEEKKLLLEAARAMCNSERRVIDPANPYMLPMGATFKEFTQYIVDNFKHGEWPDYHWSPIAKVCDLCMVEYDVIEKFETLERDHHYLLHVLGRPELLPMIAGSHTNPSSKDNTDVIRYLDMLDEQLIWYLYAIYKDDFDLFGYKPHVRLRSNPNNSVL